MPLLWPHPRGCHFFTYYQMFMQDYWSPLTDVSPGWGYRLAGAVALAVRNEATAHYIDILETESHFGDL